MRHLIFDYDGTIHDSIHIYAPAFRSMYAHLVTLGEVEKRAWTDIEISRWLGYNNREMWHAFLPDLSQDQKNECSQRIGDSMLQLIKAGKAVLYPHAMEVLQTLKETGDTLIFLSNCKRSYMEAHVENFQLNHYFSDFYCSEDFGFKPKHEIFSVIKENHEGEFVVIGDRIQDMEMAQKHGLKAIGCRYGYGEIQELAQATMWAVQVADIVPLLEKI